MATGDLTDVFSTLFTAPTGAVVDAAREQRRIWRDWLRDVLRLVEAAEDAATKRAILAEHLALAPTWQLTAQVSVGVTMRVASIERAEGGAMLGLGVGLLQGAGSFGWMHESSTESVLQARAQFALGNEREVRLADYLKTLGVELNDEADVRTAITTLHHAATPLPPLPAIPETATREAGAGGLNDGV